MESANRIGFNFVPLPFVSQIEPPRVTNLASFNNIIVKGSHFYDSNELYCLINGKKFQAVYLSEGSVSCNVQIAKNTIGLPYLNVQVTNDAGISTSNSF